ncbi:MAG: MBL fold metallo-hydrolase, partial [Lachnospiraceae bacterium]|nr:MBL fold metallo-hydrolase [Lachnospiraceae bacterium]
MQVIFIHHSCFLVEVDNKVLIFDYFDRNRVNGYTFHGKIPTYEPDTPIYMFASHSHTDHFDMDILRWADQYPNIHYILSKDIRISPNF